MTNKYCKAVSASRLLCVALLSAVSALTLVSCIDEDLSRCGRNYCIDYTVRMKTNMQAEISSELATAEEYTVGERLKQALGDVFSGVARDLDLSFFSDGKLAHHEFHTINASAASFTIYLNADDYMHLALANEQNEPAVTTTGHDSEQMMNIANAQTDTVDSHSMGLFTARMPMKVENLDKVYEVDLYMQNNVAALVIDRNGLQPEELYGYVTGLATDFSVKDSVYNFARNAVTRTMKFDEGNYSCLYTTGFPSRSDISAVPNPEKGIWQFYVYAKIGGKYTETRLSVKDPIKAADLKIIKAKLNGDGSVTVNAPDVGVSVTLDWKPGGNHDIEI